MERCSLLTLSLEAFGEYVTRILRNLFELLNHVSPRKIATKYLQNVCSNLHRLVQNNIPPNLANAFLEVNLKKISQIVDRYIAMHLKRTKFSQENLPSELDFLQYDFGERHEEYKKIVIRIASLVACALTHKSTSTFRYDNSIDPVLQKQYLEDVLHRSHEFKVLVLKDMEQSEKFPHLKNLEIWMSSKSTDRTIRFLENSASTLHTLDMRHSGEGITDNSIESILKFRQLNSLNISDTNISSTGRAVLFEGLKFEEDTNQVASTSDVVAQPVDSCTLRRRRLKQTEKENVFHGEVKQSVDYFARTTESCVRENRKVNLKSLSLTLEPDDLFPLVNNLTNLTAIQFSLTEQFDLMPLKELKHLNSMSVASLVADLVSSKMNDLIKAIGHRLKTLKLYFLGEIELKDISNYCTSLKAFTHCIGSSEYPFFGSATDDELSAYFPSRFDTVETLELITFENEMWRALPLYLSCLPNVKRLDLNSYSKREGENTTSLRECVLSLLSENRVEELMFNDHKIELGTNCVSITSFCGYTITIPIEESEEILRKLHEQKDVKDVGRNVRIIPCEILRHSQGFCRPLLY